MIIHPAIIIVLYIAIGFGVSKLFARSDFMLSEDVPTRVFVMVFWPIATLSAMFFGDWDN